jgi:hypothetical protein
MKIEDLQLIHIGFSYSELLDMPLNERRQYLQLGTKLNSVRKYDELFKLADVGVVTNGFSNKNAKKKIVNGWRSDLNETMKSLNDMGVATGGNGKGASGKRRRTAAVKPKSFKDKMAEIKQRRLGVADG